jgi:DNA repair protein RecN (Recombination protein N)
MLESLLIRNIALFEEASIHFDAGLHVLTGETGAGKSLVVDAVNFLCGAKIDRDVIRFGCDYAYVEGIFRIKEMIDLIDQLEELSISTEDGQLILSRELNKNGRSIFRVNGRAFTLSVYQTLTVKLIDLHGQHEHQSLLHESKHLRYLDLLGDQTHEALLQQTREMFNLYTQAKKGYISAQKNYAERSERLEILEIRHRELRDAKLIPGEEEALQAEKNTLRNAEKIISTIQRINDALFDSAQEETAGSQLRLAQSMIDKIVEYHPVYSGIQERLSSLYYELEEISHDLSRQLRETSHDNDRLEVVESRLDQLRKLQRKYGPTSEHMLQVLHQIEEELLQFENLDEDLDRLQKDAGEYERKFHALATQLSESRTLLAKHIGQHIEAELKDLNMTGTRFHIQVIADIAHPHPDGIDQVSMLIAPNAGEELKPLSKIASGGELSRVMLAMKTLAAERNVIPTMVFDEIDTGVSGKTALIIAQKLWEIAKYRQVICVTHLHQLAAMACMQYHVSKNEDEGRTQASINQLDQPQRIEEIAKMLGDIRTQGKSSVQHAKVLLDDAEQYRIRH